MTGTPELRPLGETLGTEAVGIDLSRLDDDTFDWISNAFAEHPVLVFRDQKLAASDIASFGRRFGTPRKHALVKYRHAEYPEVSWLTNVEEDGAIDWYGVKRATDWHTDSTYEPELPLLAMLHALEVPSRKGGTMFANMQAAYDALPAETKERLAGLKRAARAQFRTGRRAPVRRRKGSDGKGVHRTAPARRHCAPGYRTSDPVRQPDAHARFCRNGPRGCLGAD